jgi:hypothetical protein
MMVCIEPTPSKSMNAQTMPRTCASCMKRGIKLCPKIAEALAEALPGRCRSLQIAGFLNG